MSAPVSIKWTLGETYRARLLVDDLFDPTTAFTPVHGEILAKLKAATALTKDQATWEPSPAKALIEIRLPGCKTYEVLSSAHRTPTLVARRARLRVVDDKQDMSGPETHEAQQNCGSIARETITSNVHVDTECPDLLKAFLEAGSSSTKADGFKALPAGTPITEVADANPTDVNESARPHPVLPSYTSHTKSPTGMPYTFGSGRQWGTGHALPASPRFVTQIEVSTMIDAKIAELSDKLTAQSLAREQASPTVDHPKNKHYSNRYHSRNERTQEFVHNAVCDACDKHIRGERYKCLECPDFDSCGSCWTRVSHEHGSHRFVRVLDDSIVPASRAANPLPVHHGILCDGPLCQQKKTPITGDRYKCMVCADYDHCTSCEAYPQSTHSIHHAMVKMRTPAAASNNVDRTQARSSTTQALPRLACILKQHGVKESFAANPEGDYSTWSASPLADVQKGQAIKNELKQAFVDLGTKMRTAMNTCEAVRKVKHLTVVCDDCDKTVYGSRYMCATCKDFDLCQECYNNNNNHSEDHVFVQYKHFVNNVIVPRTKIAAASPVVRAGEHKGYFCNECSQSPMLGKRYNCLVCKDYDACENCKDMHKHVDHPLQIVPAVVAATSATEKSEKSSVGKDKSNQLFEEQEQEQEPSITKSEQSEDVSVPSETAFAAVVKSSDAVDKGQNDPIDTDRALSSEFVQDVSIPDGTVVSTGVTFIKQWLVKNDGGVAWPVGVRAVVTGGSFSKCVIPETFSFDHGEGGLALDHAVQPGDSVVISVQLQAPSEELSNATTYFKLATENGWRFGCKLWADVDVAPEVVQQSNRLSTAQTTATVSTEASTHSDMIFPSASMELRKGSTASEDSTSCAGTQQADDWHSEGEISLSDDEDYDVLDNESFSDEA